MHLAKFLLIISFLFTSVVFHAQSCNSYIMGMREEVSKSKLCPEEMLDDLHKLRDALDIIQPDLYHYITKEQLDSAYRVATRKVSNDLTAYEFSKTIALFLSSIKDSHTNFNPQNLLFLGPKDKGTLPFFLIRVGDKFYVESIYNDDRLKGKEIIQFNDFKVEEIFKESKAFSLIEGSAYSAQEEIATKGMALTFSLMSSFKASDFVTIDYVSGNDTLNTKVKATNKMNLYLFKDPLFEKSVSFFFDQENRGVLKILTFQPKTIGLYKKEVSRFFNEAIERNCTEIIIDLRDNQGGYVQAQEYLISFLNSSKKPYAVQHIYKRSNFDPFFKMSFLKKARFKIKAKREYPLGIHSEEYDFMRSELGSIRKITYNNIPQNEGKQTYKGKCTLVMNGLSMSASVLFAGWFRNAQRGEIIGKPCLGPMSGTFGTSVKLNLPGTGLPVIISTVKFNPQHSKEKQLEPIIPDQLIDYTIEDVLLNRDPVWKKLNIIK